MKPFSVKAEYLDKRRFLTREMCYRIIVLRNGAREL